MAAGDGTGTFTETTHTSVKKIALAWTSGTTDGAYSGTTTNPYDGECIGLTTIPSTTAAPSADYDLVVNDASGHDVLLGAGANRSASATEHAGSTSLAGVAGSKLTFNVSNAGNEKAGTAILYIR